MITLADVSIIQVYFSFYWERNKKHLQVALFLSPTTKQLFVMHPPPALDPTEARRGPWKCVRLCGCSDSLSNGFLPLTWFKIAFTFAALFPHNSSALSFPQLPIVRALFVVSSVRPIVLEALYTCTCTSLFYPT